MQQRGRRLNAALFKLSTCSIKKLCIYVEPGICTCSAGGKCVGMVLRSLKRVVLFLYAITVEGK